MYIDAHNHLLMSHAVWDGEKPRVLPCDAIRARLETGRAGAVGLIVGGRRAFPQRAPESSWWGTLDALSQFWRGQAEAEQPLRVVRTAEDVDRLSSELPSVLLGVEGACRASKHRLRIRSPRCTSCFDSVCVRSNRSAPFRTRPSMPARIATALRG